MPRKDLESRKEYAQQYKTNNAEKLRAYHAAYRQKNKEKIAEKRRLRSEENKEYAKQYRINAKQNVYAAKKRYVEKNRSHVNYYFATRRSEKIKRTPSWLNDIDFERIKNEYKLAELLSKLTGEPWHVDHIIPLKGKYVSGLHVPSNLRAIKGIDNMVKHNAFEVVHA